jgi:hypothetical protein
MQEHRVSTGLHGINHFAMYFVKLLKTLCKSVVYMSLADFFPHYFHKVIVASLTWEKRVIPQTDPPD